MRRPTAHSIRVAGAARSLLYLLKRWLQHGLVRMQSIVDFVISHFDSVASLEVLVHVHVPRSRAAAILFLHQRAAVAVTRLHRRNFVRQLNRLCLEAAHVVDGRMLRHREPWPD